MPNIVIGQYIKGNSWLHRLDPRIKLISMILLIIAVFLIKSTWIMGAFLIFMVFVVLSARIPIVKMLKGLKPLIFLLFFTIIIQIIYIKGSNPPLHTFHFHFNFYSLLGILGVFIAGYLLARTIRMRTWLFLLMIIFSFWLQILIKSDFLFSKNYHLHVYEDALVKALFVFLRIIIVISISSLLTFTTSPIELNNGLESVISPLKIFKFPVSDVAMMFSLTLRYIPTLLEETQKIMKAQASRGVDYNEGKLKDKITQILSLLVPMFAIVLNSAEDMANAMEARGFVIGAKRTKYNKMEITAFDIVVLGIVFLILFALIGVRIWM